MNRPSRPTPDRDRQLGEFARVGVIECVDADAGKIVVRYGDQLSPPIDWMTALGDVTVWLLPTVGVQVLVLNPESDAAQGVVLGGLPSSAFAHLFRGRTAAIRFADAGEVTYDPEAGALTVHAVQTVSIIAPAGATIDGDLAVTGALDVAGDVASQGTVTAATDVVGGGKSLKTHRHIAVQPGSGVSGAPQ